MYMYRWVIYGIWLLTVGCRMPGQDADKWGRSSFADAQVVLDKAYAHTHTHTLTVTSTRVHTHTHRRR